MGVAEDEEDQGTSDLALGLKTQLEKKCLDVKILTYLNNTQKTIHYVYRNE